MTTEPDQETMTSSENNTAKPAVRHTNGTATNGKSPTNGVQPEHPICTAQFIEIVGCADPAWPMEDTSELTAEGVQHFRAWHLDNMGWPAPLACAYSDFAVLPAALVRMHHSLPADTPIPSVQDAARYARDHGLTDPAESLTRLRTAGSKERAEQESRYDAMFGGAPVDFDARSGPPFPVEHVPRYVADMIACVAHAMKVDTAMTGAMALGNWHAASNLLPVRVCRPSAIDTVDEFSAWVENGGDGMLTLAPTGSKKSPVMKAMGLRAILAAEKVLNSPPDAAVLAQRLAALVKARDRLAAQFTEGQSTAILQRVDASTGAEPLIETAVRIRKRLDDLTEQGATRAELARDVTIDPWIAQQSDHAALWKSRIGEAVDLGLRYQLIETLNGHQNGSRYLRSIATIEAAREQWATETPEDPYGFSLPEVESELIRLDWEIGSLEHVLAHAQLVVNDATPEAFAPVMSENRGQVSIIDTEDAFKALMGRYANGNADFRTVLKAYSGDPIRVNRKGGKGRDEIESPAITINVTVQPYVLSTLRTNAETEEVGALARMGLVVPQDHSHIERNTESVPATIGRPYQQRLQDLVVAVMRCYDPMELTLTAEAYDEVMGVELEAIRMRLPGELLAQRDDMALKFTGRVVRLARVVHMMEHAQPGEDAEEGLRRIIDTPISVESVRHGFALAVWLMQHTMIALDVAPSSARGVDPSRFTRVRRYLATRYDAAPMNPIRRVDISNNVWNLTASERDDILTVLEDGHHVITTNIKDANGKGMEVVYVNRHAPRTA